MVGFFPSWFFGSLRGGSWSSPPSHAYGFFACQPVDPSGGVGFEGLVKVTEKHPSDSYPSLMKSWVYEFVDSCQIYSHFNTEPWLWEKELVKTVAWEWKQDMYIYIYIHGMSRSHLQRSREETSISFPPSLSFGVILALTVDHNRH